jgi:NADH-quinone oxidoreductase subunit L
MIKMLWLVPLLPFAGFVVNGLLVGRLSKRWAGIIACGAVLGSFLISLGAVGAVASMPTLSAESADMAGPGIVLDHAARRATVTVFNWLPLGPGRDGRALSVPWSYVLDPLSSVMLLVVTGIGFLIHLYSIGYMEHEEQAGFGRFFCYLNLFTGMMLLLVLGGSLPVLFVGWEGVGLCSYLLIGFWYDRMFDEKTGMSCADAGRKAFIVNRIGDAGFILGTLLLLSVTGTTEIQKILGASLSPGVATAAALLLFIGVCGKSAQIPLYVWLPDAMAGPTPVSALIHAATMVTAGVYLLARMGSLYLQSPQALLVVAVTGALTALFAATIGAAQTDIKKVLAYSTVSQLGYMVLGAGVGAFGAGVFHLMTHAFFKALLFLGAGSVIHALSGEQDIMKMGGLRQKLPWTHATFLIGVLAIAGVPPLAGFFSKDAILWSALSSPHGSIWLWGTGVVTAGLTAFYMTRLYLLVFGGRSRLSHEAEHHLHESPAVMLLPLIVLAAGSCVAGFVGVPQRLGGYAASIAAAEPGVLLTENLAMGVTLLASAAGIALGWFLYSRRPDLPGRIASASGGLFVLVRDAFRVDALYGAIVVRPYARLAAAMAWTDRIVVDGLVNGAALATLGSSYTSRAFDLGVVDGLVNASGWAARRVSVGLRRLQGGVVQSYATAMIAGLFVLVSAYLLFMAR